MGFDVDADSIESTLRACIPENVHEGTADLVVVALKRALSKELSKQTLPQNIKPLEQVPENAPGWLCEKFRAGQPVYAFDPDPHTIDHIRHVADWINAALVNDAAWLNQRDAKGRPVKLSKIGSLEQAVAEADKTMRKLSSQFQALSDEAGHLETVMRFPDGARIVRLLSPEALDDESRKLGHCVGNGAYDAALKSGERVYYSVRTPSGKAAATMEIGITTECGNLLQCKGKQNQPPVTKYMPYVQKFLKARNLKLDECPAMTGLIEQDGAYYDIYNLPENFHYRANLDLSHTTVGSLPTGLKVDGWLDITHTPIARLPEDLCVTKDLIAGSTNVCKLPTKFQVGRTLCLSDTAITNLPDNLTINGDLRISGTPLRRLPKNLRVDGCLAASFTEIFQLPSNLHVGGGLYLTSTQIQELPHNLKVSGNLFVRATPLKKLPENLYVKNKLDISNTGITSFPSSLRVDGEITTTIAVLPNLGA